MITVNSLEEGLALQSRDLASEERVTVTQERINAFADCTGDHQWIHVDPERAKHSPFGSTIAHGYLTLSLISSFWSHTVKFSTVKMGVNYGLQRVRFPSPAPVNSELGCSFHVDEVKAVEGGIQLEITATIGIDGAPKPVCVATWLVRLYF